MTRKLAFLTKLSIAFAVLFQFLPINLGAQCEAHRFKHFTVEEGLSQNTVYDILQDHMGFIWFATDNGLNRFDGINFKIYNHTPNDSLSLSNGRVISIVEDSQKRLWVGTIGGGLNLYNWKTDSFTAYINNPNEEHSLSNNKVMALAEDLTGKIWVGTADGGLNHFNPETGKFTVYKNTSENPNVLPSNVIRSLYVEKSGKLWIGTNNGLAVYSPDEQTIRPFYVYTANGNRYNLGTVRRIYEDNSGNIWIATDKQGAIVYNVKSKDFTIYKHNPLKTNSLPNNAVHDFLQDEDGDIWIATYGGLSKLKIPTNSFTNHTNTLYNTQSISSNQVRRIYEDKMGILWIGTDNNGINKLDTKAKKFVVYRSFPESEFNISSTCVSAIYQDSDGAVWLGTTGHGLVRFDVSKESFQYIKTGLPNSSITSVSEDKNGDLWVGTISGLAKYSKQTGQFKKIAFAISEHKEIFDWRVRHIHIGPQNDVWVATQDHGLVRFSINGKPLNHYRMNFNDPKSLSQDRINAVFEDKFGNVWVATSHEGLNLLSKETGQVKKVFRKNSADSTSIPSDRVLSFHQDKVGRLWFGTAEGLSQYSYADSLFTNYTTFNGLPNDVISAIEEDVHGRLWVSTNKGIACVDVNNLSKPVFWNFDKHDGLPMNEFSNNASFTLNSGNILFGALNSFVSFNPLDIKSDTIVPWVYVYEARISEHNRQAEGEDDEIIINLLKSDSLSFAYSQNNLSFYVTVIHPRAPHKNSYKYILEGFDSKWGEPSISQQQFVRYTNLKPGDYTFRVIAQNSDGFWNEEGDSFSFTIEKPFWNKWWFYGVITLIFVGVAYALSQVREAALVKSKEHLEEMVSERTQELLLQSEQLKQANEEIRSSSEALTEQNELLKLKHEEITQKNNELEHQKNSLANLAWELQDKNEEITAQRNEIERQKKEITDSILYAQRIQQAVLPTQEQIKELFPEFFIFNRPKSIVSGDFYWATRIGKYRVVAVVDCTGHGVPGGFMSMLGVLLLNEVISLRGYVDPAKALNHLRQSIISVLHQKGEFNDASDGMDLSLCVIDDERKVITYSGANSSMIVFEPNAAPDEKLTILRSDRMPIAYHPLMKSFSNKMVPFGTDTVLFLHSDGIVDQFGGPNNKKFQHQRLLNFIADNSDLPLETQGIVLEQIFSKWKGKAFQVDDVLVMGIKL